MSKICGPIVGIVALLTFLLSAAEPAGEASAGPVASSGSAIQPVALKLQEKPLKVDDAKSNSADSKKKKSEPTSKIKSSQPDSDKSDQAGKSKKKADEKPKARKPLKRRVIVVKTTWCGACQSLNYEWPKLRKVRWRIGNANTDHFQLIDTDQDPGVVSRYGVTQLPTLLLIEDGKVIDRAGVLNAKDLAEFYYGRL